MKNEVVSGKVLITGGTSGLGRELIKLFLNKGFIVVTTGRQPLDLPGFEDKLKFYQLDFCDLNQVVDYTKRICKDYDLNLVINNAGILSPPHYIPTINGFEYTLQVNFLSHFLMNEIILQRTYNHHKIKIVTVTSPVYRLADTELRIQSETKHYSQIKAYTSSKLYLTLMSGFLASKYQGLNLLSFNFNPGTFSSGIYRSQSLWFRNLYHIASPFMRSPSRVANILTELILNEEGENGYIYDIRKRCRPIPQMEGMMTDSFFKACYKIIDPYLKRVEKVERLKS